MSKILDRAKWLKLVSEFAFVNTDPQTTTLVKAAIASLQQHVKAFAGTAKFKVVLHYAHELLDLTKGEDAETALVDRLSIYKSELTDIMALLADASDDEVSALLAELGVASETTAG